MLLIEKYSKLENAALISFTTFLFFSVIFCNSSKVNNIFHISCILLCISLLMRGQLYLDLKKNRTMLQGLSLIALFVIYFACSNIWGGDVWKMSSTLIHGSYLIIFILFISLSLQNSNRHTIMFTIIAGITTLSLFTILTDASKLLHSRKVSNFNPGPDNVIDLAGYCVIAIILSIMIAKEKRCINYLLLTAIPFIMLIMTQSRGPLMALTVVLLMTFYWYRPTLLALCLFVCLLTLMLIFTPIDKLLLWRFGSISNELNLRINIWNHVLIKVSQHPWFGLGCNQDLNFINHDGAHIMTAHSVYFGTLYKGGIVGLALLILLLSFGLRCAFHAYKKKFCLDIVLYMFMLLFIISQGMFMISNPSETWILIWLPLAVVLSAGSRATVISEYQNKTLK